MSEFETRRCFCGVQGLVFRKSNSSRCITDEPVAEIVPVRRANLLTNLRILAPIREPPRCALPLVCPLTLANETSLSATSTNLRQNSPRMCRETARSPVIARMLVVLGSRAFRALRSPRDGLSVSAVPVSGVAAAAGPVLSTASTACSLRTLWQWRTRLGSAASSGDRCRARARCATRSRASHQACGSKKATAHFRILDRQCTGFATDGPSRKRGLRQRATTQRAAVNVIFVQR